MVFTDTSNPPPARCWAPTPKSPFTPIVDGDAALHAGSRDHDEGEGKSIGVGTRGARERIPRAGRGPGWVMGFDIAADAPFAPPLPDDVAFVALDETDPDLPPLHPAEEELLGPRTAPRRRQAFTLGRAAARRALRQLGYGSPPILQGKHHEPLWPSGIVGSITHANGLALAAVGQAERFGGIGLDLEHHARWFPELSDQIAFGAEERWLASLPPEARVVATLELFSAKESVYKAFFPRVQRYFGFEAVRLWRQGDARSFVGCFVEPLDPAYPPTRSFRVDARWHGDLVLTSLVLDGAQSVHQA